MLFSFIIPSFQQGEWIGQCLDSILSQNLPPEAFEVLVMDGGSTDQTASVVQQHPVGAHFFSEPDQGQADAVNKGLRRAKGHYIAWINSDDFYHPEAFAYLQEYFASHPDHRVVYGEGDIVDRAGQRIGAYPTEDWNRSRLADKCFLCQPSVIFHREVVATVGELNPELHLTLDLEFWMRVGAVYPFHRLPRTLACSRHYPGTKSQSNPLRMQIEAALIAHQNLGVWSNRRLWSIAENRLLLTQPTPRGVPQSGTPLKFSLFWLRKTALYLSLVLRPDRTGHLHQLLQATPTPA